MKNTVFKRSCSSLTLHEQGVFSEPWCLSFAFPCCVELLQHDNIWSGPSGAVHTQLGGDWDAQRSVRVPRGKPHRAAGGAPASSREANQPGHQVRKHKHKTCTRTDVSVGTDNSPPPFFPMRACLSASDIPVCGLTNVISQLTGLHSSHQLIQMFQLIHCSVFFCRHGGGWCTMPR